MNWNLESLQFYKYSPNYEMEDNGQQKPSVEDRFEVTHVDPSKDQVI